MQIRKTISSACRATGSIPRSSASPRQIQELLGHKHLDSTQRYTSVNAHELRGAITRLRWVGEPSAAKKPRIAISQLLTLYTYRVYIAIVQ